MSFIQSMESLGIDNNKKLRQDIEYLWSHNYITILSCAGHKHKDYTAIPYIICVRGTGDGTWENFEAAKRGWTNSAAKLSRLGSIQIVKWKQTSPLN
jgi:hypothetical protein